ncbi:MAG: hypothetical protein JOZ99_12560, partial [Actinobacteria bacterium]|nr:hypothetical protein [Actinomycetota bacterium]
GNHYFLDAVSGFVTLGIGYTIATQIERFRRRAHSDVVDLTEEAAAVPEPARAQHRRAGTG